MLMLKCLAASIPPFAFLQLYYYLTQDSAPLRLSPSLLRVAGFLVVFALATLGLSAVTGGGRQVEFSHLLKVSFLLWAFFFFFFAIDAFTLHRGLAKDAQRSVTNILLEWSIDFVVFGAPLALIGSGLVHLARRFRRGAGGPTTQSGTA